MIAAQIETAGKIDLVDIPQPELAADEVLVEVRGCGICGIDFHILNGEYGQLPIIPGHEFAGIVAEVGSNVRSVRPGARVAIEPNLACNRCEMCQHGRPNLCARWQAIGVTRPGAMAEYVAVPETAAFDIGPLSFEQALFMEPLSCALHGIARARIGVGDRVLIIGAGPIGILLLKCCRVAGASRIDVVDRQEARLSHAERNGACEISSDFVTRREESYDVVIDATGVPAVLEQSLVYAAPGGRVLWFGVTAEHAQVTIEPFQLFKRELTLLSSFTSVRNSLQALRMLECNRIAVADLVSHRVPLSGLCDTLGSMLTPDEEFMKVVLLPHED